MKITALRFRRDAPAGAVTTDVWQGLARELTPRQPPTAYVVSSETLTGLKALTDIVCDRGIKHRARSLSAILLRHPRVPLVHVPVKSAGRLPSAIGTLLANAAKLRKRQAYVLGVARDVVERLAAHRGLEWPDEARVDVADDGDDNLDVEEVPVELERRLIGDSPRARSARQSIVSAAKSDGVVLILGDTGTGKEVAARAIHGLDDRRRHQPFVAVNCGAIPTELFESEMFGYVAGAFTGALKQGSEGLWRSARGGTLFLDEIGDLAPVHQPKILRALEENHVRPVGARDPVPVTARVIAATNKDLLSVLGTEFREDLYYRLATRIINLPRLRERPEDIPLLAAHFWKEVAPKRPPLPREVLDELQTYRWPGNARELRYILANLHTMYPKSVPSEARLRAVVRLRTPNGEGVADEEASQALRRLDRLQYLQRARVVVDSCQRMARRLSREAGSDAPTTDMQLEIGRFITELQLLSARGDGFAEPATFEAVSSLEGTLAAFRSLLARELTGARRYGNSDVGRSATKAAAAIRRELNRVLQAL